MAVTWQLEHAGGWQDFDGGNEGTMQFIESRYAEYTKGGAPRRSIRSKSVKKDFRFDFEAMTVKTPDNKIVKCQRVVAERAERDDARSERYPEVPTESRARSSSISARRSAPPAKPKAEVPPGAKGDPLRGLSVHYLSTTLMKEIAEAGLDENATVRHIEPKVIRCPRAKETVCPRDGELGAAYVDIVDGEENVGRATHMLSYTWSYVFKDIVDSLVAWCKQNKKDPRTIRIWMCCFCINQYRVIKAQEAGLVVPFEEFRKEFESRVRGIGQVLALMGSWQMTLYVQRVWCVFELYTAMMLQATDPRTYNLTLVMSPKEAEEFREKLLEGHGMEAVWKALNHIKVQKADAFVKADKEKILQLVEEGPGYARMNKEIVEKLHEWFTNNSERYLRQELKSSSSSRGRRRLDNLALACTRVGQMLEQTSHFKNALELLETGKTMLESEGKIHSKEGEELLRILGTAHRRLGKLQEAYEAYEEAKKVHDELGDTKCSSYATLLQDIGRIHGDYSDLEEELKCHEKAFAIRKELGLLDTPEGAMLYRSLGMVYFQKYEYAKAQDFFEKAKAMHEKTDSLTTPEGAAALQSIGDVLSSMWPPRPAEALSVLEEAFAISEQLGISKTSKGVTQLRRIAHLHKMLSDHEKAERMEKMANELEDMVGLAASTATTLEETQEAETESQRSASSKAKAIEEIKPGWGCYFEVVNDDGFSDPSKRGFPHQLTTFETAATKDIKPRHVHIDWGNLDTLTVEGREWSLDTSLFDKESTDKDLKKLKALVNHGQVKGYLSPLHEVNLSDSAKKVAGIPPTARHFMFSYPVTFEAAPAGKHMPDCKNSDIAFLANGGFVYLDESATTVIRMNAVLPAIAGGLRFGPPLKWEPKWTQRLLHADRLRPITVKVIRETGATHFCWIRPNEVMWFGESGGAPICPYGGFAYICLDESMKESAAEDTRGGRGGSSLRGKRPRGLDDEGLGDAPAPARARHGR